jgi:Restriction alleviation protein Lar
MDDNLLPCPMCGSPAKMDFTGASESYGNAWQTLYIRCNEEKDPHCGMELSLMADFWDIRNADDALIEAWNRLDRK